MADEERVVPVSDVALEEAASMTSRDVFLLEMYKQCSGHLNRHVSSVWQCLAVMAAAVASISVSPDASTFDFAAAIAIAVCAWFAASTLDASAWFNRNITIITNIERLFLREEDAKLVHPFFLSPHKHDRVITNFKIHLVLAAFFAFSLLVFHARERQLFSCEGIREADWPSFLPCVVAGISFFLVRVLAGRQHENQLAVNRTSPGKQLKQRADGY